MKELMQWTLLVGLLAVGGWLYLLDHVFVDSPEYESSDGIQKATQLEDSEMSEQLFLENGLTTNTSKSSLDLALVLDGGPGKDGIPAIHEPNFLTIDQARSKPHLREDGIGIVVVVEDVAKFYPYSVLNRHEIVNDTVMGQEIAVTFCPLCGSAIVFDRRVGDTVLKFGVSGKLYNSNLLMYDDQTESLWSQALGEGVIGEYMGAMLDRLDSDIMTWDQFQQQFPEGLVLSDETGYPRNYTQAPYGDYDENDQLFFPVTNTDARLPKKELLYVINDGEQSIAFVRDELRAVGQASIEVDGQVYTANYDNGMVSVSTGGEEIPGFVEMRFSRVTHNPNALSIWTGESQ